MDNSIYKAEEIGEGLWAIGEGGVRSFLVDGGESALLVDTGFGGGDLSAFVNGIVGKPVHVALTHSDGDHTGALRQFGKAAIHPCDFPYISENVASLSPLWEGDMLSYGMYSFQVLHTPGHTPGSVMLFDWGKGILISGDSIQEGPIFMFGANRCLASYIASLERLIQTGVADKATAVFAAHNALRYSPSIIPQCLEDARSLLAGELEGREAPFGMLPSECKVYSGKSVKFLY
jgi:glyoxylase-like metal-dependent hydrolase (beta-lactamase superfamily II)